MYYGVEFQNTVIKELRIKFKMIMNYNTPYNPRTNGRTERSNQIIIRKICRLMGSDIGTWDKYFYLAIFNHNITPQKFNKLSPYEIIFNIIPQSKKIINDIEEVEKKIEKKFEEKEKYILKNNEGKKELDDLEINDFVLVKNREKIGKFELLWIGPFIISAKNGFGSYQITSLENTKKNKIHRRDLIRFNNKENFTTMIGNDM